MPRLKLTDAAVKRLGAPPGVQVDYFDANLPGFALRVSGPTPRNPDGRKGWVALYRFGGQLKRLTMQSSYPTTGLADARQWAREVFQTAHRGEDPSSAQRATTRPARGPDTVESVIAEFMRRHMADKARAPRYVVETQRNFDNHVLPHWRGRLIGSITRCDVIELLDQIVDSGNETARRQGRKLGGPVAANRVRAAISALFNWAMRRGIVESSPATMVEKPGTERKKTRVLSDAELRLIWRGTEALPYPWRPYFRLLIVTGQRREETATLRWRRDIDEAEAIWMIPAEANKPDRTHAVPLSRLALSILAECPQGGGYVFTTRRQRHKPGMGEPGEAPISGFSKAKAELDAEIARIASETGEPVNAWTLHDLRRTATTTMGRFGVPRFIQQRILNHADSSVTGIYDRWEYLPEKRAALDKWARHIETLVLPPPVLRIVS
jgi:integrase